MGKAKGKGRNFCLRFIYIDQMFPTLGMFAKARISCFSENSFYITRVRTQGFVLAKHILYHLRKASNTANSLKIVIISFLTL
jgi:hypothetical protein